MNVTCPNCASMFRVDPSKIPEGGVRARCNICSAVFAVRREGDAQDHPAAVASGGADAGGRPMTSGSAPSAAAPSVAMPSAPSAPAAPSTPAPTPMVPRAEPVRPAFPANPATPAMPAAPARPIAPSPPVSSPATPPRPASFPPPAAPMGSPRPAAPAGQGAPAAPAARPMGMPAAPPAPPPAPSPPAAAAPVAPPSPAQPHRPAPTTGARPVNPFLSQDPALKARRLARALISDMVVYHPTKRQDGLRDGNLKELFEEEIRKSWEEYADQVGKDVADGTPYFKEALNEILAGGRQIF